MQTENPVFIVDTREQRPYQFSGETVRAGLCTGDYSIKGLESVAAVERKELSDFINCVTFDRDRFCRELERAAAFQRFWVIIEGSIDQIERGQYRSKVNPESVLGSIAAWENRFNVRFVFAGNRQTGERTAKRLLITNSKAAFDARMDRISKSLFPYDSGGGMMTRLKENKSRSGYLAVFRQGFTR